MISDYFFSSEMRNLETGEHRFHGRVSRRSMLFGRSRSHVLEAAAGVEGTPRRRRRTSAMVGVQVSGFAPIPPMALLIMLV